jgi:hypothetical protein
VAAEIAGLPGAPVRTKLVAGGDGVPGAGDTYTATPMPYITGTPPAFSYTYYAFLYPPWNDVAIPNDANDASWNSEFQQQFLMTFVAQPNSSPLSATQDAVVTALMAVAGSPAHVFQGEGGGKVGGGH